MIKAQRLFSFSRDITPQMKSPSSRRAWLEILIPFEYMSIPDSYRNVYHSRTSTSFQREKKNYQSRISPSSRGMKIARRNINGSKKERSQMRFAKHDAPDSRKEIQISGGPDQVVRSSHNDIAATLSYLVARSR